MNDEMPRRLDEEGLLTEEERRVLSADAAFRPPAAERDAMWAALASQLPPGGGAAGDPSAAGPVAATAIPGLKVVLGIAASAGLWLGARALLHENAPPRSEPSAAASFVETDRSAAGAAPALQGPSEPGSGVGVSDERQGSAPEVSTPHQRSSRKSAPAAGARPASATPPPSARPATAASSAAPTEAASRLQAEGEALDRARSALRQGDPGRAQQLLDQASAEFSAGMLVQEREALAVETLWAGGRRDEARDRARRFLVRYPASPLAARVRTYAK